MTIIRIKINQKNLRVASVEKEVVRFVREEYPEAKITTEKIEPVESRNDRYQEAKSLILEAISKAEGLRDELQDWLDNLPESLQGGEKASLLEESIGNLEEFISSCEQASDIDVEFPGMMG